MVLIYATPADVPRITYPYPPLPCRTIFPRWTFIGGPLAPTDGNHGIQFQARPNLSNCQADDACISHTAARRRSTKTNKITYI